MNGIYLSALPLSAKLFCTLFLVGIGLGSVAAFVQAATAVGLTPADVQASLGPEMPMMHMGHGQTSAEKEIRIDEISDTARVWMRTPLLIQTSHTHLFGQTLIAGLLGLIFLFTRMGDAVKATLVSLPFVGTILDIGGMWLTRFVSPSLAPIVLIGGTMFGIGYAIIAFITLYDLWLRKEQIA